MRRISRSAILVLIASLLFLSCSETPPKTYEPYVPKHDSPLKQTQVIKAVEASNNAQTGYHRVPDYSGAPYYYKSEWGAKFLGDDYSYIGDDWTDMWLVYRRHIYEGVWSLNTAYWLYRESTGEVIYLDWHYYRPENEAYLLEMAAKQIRDGTLKPN